MKPTTQKPEQMQIRPKNMKTSLTTFIHQQCFKTTTACLLILFAVASGHADQSPHWALSPTPPLGWNSYDAFGDSVTEQEFLINAEFVKEKLLAYGWNYVVVDYRWYDPTAHSSDLKDRVGVPLTSDKYGRLLPATNRFPSALDHNGFKSLSTKVQSMGLKFGIHIMRGIPKQSVLAKTPIEGSPFRADEAANLQSTCWWNPDMYGVNGNSPAGQAWYDSIIRQYAEWGVDFIKVDDLSNSYRDHEVEAIRRAIDKCGRAIIFSTSPGATPLAKGEHVKKHANMWRISGDFWDNWDDLLAQFRRLADWAPFQGEGHWPDADMIPFGKIGIRCHDAKGTRMTKFTPDEQTTLISLWSIARSPLMLGGNLPDYSEHSLSLITNKEILAINSHSKNNRQLWNKNDGGVAWVADVPNSKDKYLAVFNVKFPIDVSDALWKSPLVNKDTPNHCLPIDVDITGAKKIVLVAEDGGDGYHGDHVDWIEPRLSGPAGQLKLTDLKWTKASSGWGEAKINKSVSGDNLQINGEKVEFGIGVHAPSVIEYDLPAGYTRFQAKAGLDDSGTLQKKGATVNFYVLAPKIIKENPSLNATVVLSDLGFNGKCKVRDLWSQKDLGEIDQKLDVEVPFHGARVFRISPLQEK
jgi:hypothetical protein